MRQLWGIFGTRRNLKDRSSKKKLNFLLCWGSRPSRYPAVWMGPKQNTPRRKYTPELAEVGDMGWEPCEALWEDLYYSAMV